MDVGLEMKCASAVRGVENPKFASIKTRMAFFTAIEIVTDSTSPVLLLVDAVSPSSMKLERPRTSAQISEGMKTIHGMWEMAAIIDFLTLFR